MEEGRKQKKKRAGMVMDDGDAWILYMCLIWGQLIL
jgi:hypothetical protein